MRYVGGKARIAKWIRDHILAVADEYRGVALTYVEPFVGSGAVLEQVVRSGRFRRHIANDIHPDLIRMWHALSREGWEPPVYVTKEDYRELQSSSQTPSPLRGYAGFCTAFGGKWMGWLEQRVPQQQGERLSVLRRARVLRGVEWKNVDYAEIVLQSASVVYCDPPYIGTTGYDCGDFDHERFWSTMDQWVAGGAIVFVSEYRGPPHWLIADEIQRLSILGTRSGQRDDVRTEKLFMRRP